MDFMEDWSQKYDKPPFSFSIQFSYRKLKTVCFIVQEQMIDIRGIFEGSLSIQIYELVMDLVANEGSKSQIW